MQNDRPKIQNFITDIVLVVTFISKEFLAFKYANTRILCFGGGGVSQEWNSITAIPCRNLVGIGQGQELCEVIYVR